MLRCSAGLSLTASERHRWIVARLVDGDANERSSNSAALSTDSTNPSIVRNT